MKRSILTVAFAGFAALGITTTGASAAVVFGVDYGGQTDNTPIQQDVFPDHTEASGPNSGGAVPMVTTDGTHSASLSGTSANGAQFQYRVPGQTSRNDVDGTSVDDLIEDLVVARDASNSAVTGNMQLTLTGLAAGNYTFRSYHNENLAAGANTGFVQGQTITAFIGATNMGSTVPIDLDSNGGANTNTDADLRFIEFGITSDGATPIVIDYTSKLATGADSFMFINGFTITPEPASLALLGLGGLMMLRRRRSTL